MSEISTRLTTALADRYRLERELGQGGMATVYLAQDLRHRRNVAIKVLHPELSRRSWSVPMGRSSSSPDGAWVGFLASGQLRRVPIGGGSVIPIGDIGRAPGSFRGATWTDRGEIIFATTSGMQRIPGEGGSVRPLALRSFEGGTPGPNPRVFFPTALPGGTHVLATLASPASPRPPELAVLSLSDGKVTVLGQAGSNPRYVEPGFLAFTSADGTLNAVRFDARRRRIAGPPLPIAEGIPLGIGGGGRLDVSRGGPGPRYQASVGGGASPRWNPRVGELFLLSRDSLIAVPVRSVGATLELGRGKALFANQFAPLNYHAPYDVSPDGSWFVFVGGTGTSFSSSFRVVLNWFEQPAGSARQ
ncbi:MAG: hypothetical protein ACRENB_04500 [Gemmatimonadales bacterium]